MQKHVLLQTILQSSSSRPLVDKAQGQSCRQWQWQVLLMLSVGTARSTQALCWWHFPPCWTGLLVGRCQFIFAVFFSRIHQERSVWKCRDQPNPKPHCLFTSSMVTLGNDDDEKTEEVCTWRDDHWEKADVFNGGRKGEQGGKRSRIRTTRCRRRGAKRFLTSTLISLWNVHSGITSHHTS